MIDSTINLCYSNINIYTFDTTMRGIPPQQQQQRQWGGLCTLQQQQQTGSVLGGTTILLNAGHRTAPFNQSHHLRPSLVNDGVHHPSSRVCILPPVTSMPPGAVYNVVHSERELDVPSDGFDSIEMALDALKRGLPAVVLDDEDRENEGDLIVPASVVTEETMAFIVEHTSGVICVGMTGEDLDRLDVPLMIPPSRNEEAMSTAFTVTVDLREGTTTGISAADRTRTIRALADSGSVPEDFKRPGHIFPLRYRHGGVLTRPGHTEASVDLSRLAGCAPAGVLCEIVNKDGTMARTPELLEFSKKYGLPCITIADLIRYRLKHDALVERTAEGMVSTRYGNFTAYSYRATVFDVEQEHVALVYGPATSSMGEGVLARVQNESILGDLFGSERCGSGSQFDMALEKIVEEGQGVFVYVRGQKGRGMGIAEELKAFHATSIPREGDGVACSMLKVNDGGFTSDMRDYAIAAHIFRDLGVESIRLLTDNMNKAQCLSAHGLTVERVLPMMTS